MIKQLEAAKAGSREFDAEIWLANVPGATRKETPVPDHMFNGRTRKGWTIDETRQDGRLITVPDYTTSLDAAMTLIPDCAQWTFDSHYNIAHVHIYYNVDGVGPQCYTFDGEGCSPAVALCIAALRARAAANEA